MRERVKLTLSGLVWTNLYSCVGQSFDLFVFLFCVMLAGRHSLDFSSSHSELINMPQLCTAGEKENQNSCSLRPCQCCAKRPREMKPYFNSSQTVSNADVDLFT